MFVYFIKSMSKPSYTKIGYSADPEKRILDLQIGCPFELKLIGCIKCDNPKKAQQLESHLHRRFRPKRAYGEWFSGDIEFKSIGYDVLSPIDMEIAGHIPAKSPVRGQPLLMHASDVTLGALKYDQLGELKAKIERLINMRPEVDECALSTTI